MTKKTLIDIRAAMAIKPKTIDVGGEKVEVTSISVTSINDNLNSAVTFQYYVNKANDEAVASGYFSLDENNYDTWDASRKHAYKLVCDSAGYELLGV